MRMFARTVGITYSGAQVPKQSLPGQRVFVCEAGGAPSEVPPPPGPRSYFTRREMGQGRVPPASTIVMGGPYEIGLEYKGEEPVRGAISDRLAISLRGPSSNVAFELLFARDAARTPSLARTPLPVGVFSLELSR